MPEKSGAASTFLLRAASSNDVQEALELLIAHGFLFDLVFIDHDHRLPALFTQIKCTMELAHPGTIFVFDDAIPPSFDMAGPVPGKGWWTGQVWLLKSLLSAANDQSVIECVNSRPTGALFAVGLGELDKVAFDAHADVEPQSDKEILEATSPVSEEDLFRLLDGPRKLIESRNFLQVRFDTGSAIACQEKTLDRSIEVDRTPPRLVCVARSSNAPALNLSRLIETRRKIHEKRVTTFSDSFCVGYDQVVSGDTITSRYFASGLSHIERLALGFGTHVNADSGIRKGDGSFLIPRWELNCSEQLDCRVFLGTPDEPMNYGMWLLLAIPSAREFVESDSEYDRFLCLSEKPWQRLMLETAGVDERSMIRQDRRRYYRCKSLSMVRHSYRDLYVTDGDRQIFHDLARQVQHKSRQDYPRKVFLSRLSRTRAGGYRGLTNEEDLLKGVIDLGFEIVEPELLSFEEQIGLFSSVDVVAGLGGAGMFNSVFCRPGTKILDIESGMVFLDAHCNLFASMQMDYGVIIGEEDLDDPRPTQKRWKLQLDVALDAIRDFCS